MILPLTLFLIWYGLRWYFVIPRDEYLGSFNYKNLYSIRMIKKINYDDTYYYYAYKIDKNTSLPIEIEFYTSDYGGFKLTDFIFEQQKDYCLIKLEHESINKIDTLLILDNLGNEKFNSTKNFINN